MLRAKLRELELAQRLWVIARSDEVPHGKPAPDVFLEAARKMGVAAADCIAFEDAPMGLVAAGRAGIPLFGAGALIAGAFWTLAWLAPRPGEPLFIAGLATAAGGCCRWLAHRTGG